MGGVSRMAIGDQGGVRPAFGRGRDEVRWDVWGPVPQRAGWMV